MTESDRDNEALIVFMQGLAVTIVRIDELAPKDRTAENFLRCLDGHTNVLVGIAEQEGSDIGGAMKVFRQNLTTALRQAKLATMRPTGAGH